jgi:transposase
MATDKHRGRRNYSAEFKAQVVAECDAPGASVAKVAMSHGINANVVHGWRQLARIQAASAGKAALSQQSEFIPISLAPPARQAQPQSTPLPDIQVELRRGTLSLKINWPLSGAAEFTAWSKELLQ